MTKRGATTNNNPWTAIRAKIKQLEEENVSLRMEKRMQEFGRELGNNLVIIMANKPFTHWTPTEKAAFQSMEQTRPTLAYFYMQQHAKAHGTTDKLPLKYRV